MSKSDLFSTLASRKMVSFALKASVLNLALLCKVSTDHQRVEDGRRHTAHHISVLVNIIRAGDLGNQ